MILPKRPFRVEFEVINSCNLNCLYCYAKPFDGNLPKFEKIKYLISKTAEEVKPFEAVILGGEPFLRRDIVDVLEYAYNEFNGNIGTSTNGTRLANLDLRELAKLKSIFTSGSNRSNLQISIDSVNSTVNDKTRGMTEQSIKGMETLEKNDISFSVGIVITQENLNNISDTLKFLLASYGNLKSINLEPLQPSVTISHERYTTLKVDNKDLLEIYRRANELKSITERNDVKITGDPNENCSINRNEPTMIDGYNFKQCTAGLLRSGVFTSGDVTPCVTIRNVTLGNLFNESWDIIWNRALERYLKLNIEGGQCQINMLRHGNIEKPVAEKVKQK